MSGHRRDWGLPPDEVFLRSLESHLEWPVSLLRQHLYRQAEKDRGFDSRLQEWMVGADLQVRRSQPEEWPTALDAAARSLAYIWTNRLIFYKALRARFPELPKLELAASIKTTPQALRRLDELFQQAAERSGDYESLLFPETHDWANELVFAPEGAVDAWRAFLRGIESVDFREVSTDVVGLIFQKLVSPETRHRYGQHFTGPDPVDLINSFCIRSADATVLDPACGSGSFLVRAYYRKRAMDARRTHVAMLGDLFGCDVALYPAHLATLNLAAREINDQANYPRVERRDFFDVQPDKPFCLIPGHAGGKVPVPLPPLDAVVGNPPYVRQEKIGKRDKPKYAQVVAEAFKGTRISGRADLHCYFWPHAARLLKEGGYFGFLTSGQWLDVDYGFALQRWMLENFQIVAIVESSTERWFPDARVKTCITILRRCGDETARRENLVRFVRFEKPLAEIVGHPATGGVGEEAEELEQIRQAAVDRVRDAIERTAANVHDERWRIVVKRQGDLWDEGVRAGEAFKDAPADAADDEAAGDEEPGGGKAIANGGYLTEHLAAAKGAYVAGKWGRYLRAPDLYFEIMSRFKDRFVPLGEIVEIRRGVTSGCDDFFMPTDVTEAVLRAFQDEKEFRKAVGIARKEVVAGNVRIVKDGAGTYHPIEPEFVRPELHSLMEVDRPVVRPTRLERVVILVPAPLTAIRGTHAHRYIKYGARATYASSKSRAVPVPERSTCAGREPWYDLTTLVDPGFAFWPKSQQYRHIVPGNPQRVICNCNLYDLGSRELKRQTQRALIAVANSTLVALFKASYGRYAGTEGNLKTEVIDVNLLEVPDPRGASKSVLQKLAAAMKSMCAREVGGLVEESLKECRTYRRALELAGRPVTLPYELAQPDRRELDDAVFELLGVADAAERSRLIDRLYEETALHFRDVRVTEIQKMEDRRSGGKAKFAAADQAADAWDAVDLADLTPLVEWVKPQATGDCEVLNVPAERPVQLSEGSMFDNETVYFGKARRRHIVCQSRGEAELVARMATLGVAGEVCVPKSNGEAMQLLDRLNARHEKAAVRLRELAASRSADPNTRDEVFQLLQRWYVLGRPAAAGRNPIRDDPQESTAS